jgi:C4-dicarboxylate transporter, DctM subunit
MATMCWQFFVYAGKIAHANETTWVLQIPRAPFWYAVTAILVIAVLVQMIVVTRSFIFDLFIAALVPALLAIVLNMLAIWITVARNPAVAPLGERVSWPERWIALRDVGPVPALMIAVFAGLYSGVFTVNEAASVAAILSLVIALGRRRIDWPAVWTGLRESAAATAMIYVIIMGASKFTYFISAARVPDALIKVIGGLNVPPLAIIAIIVVFPAVALWLPAALK